METFRSLVALLARRAAEQADDRAYVFVSDRGAEEAVLSFRQLHDAAGALASRLTAAARPGDRAVLVFPPGLEFMVAFFGCLMAGIIAVPMMMPRRNSARDASVAILANCTPTVALTNSAASFRGDLRARFAQEHIRWIEVDLAPRVRQSNCPSRRRTTSPFCNTPPARRPRPKA
jgi:acyl-CoA synthetase (AMP-forming)/AMP-acid ligase II